ncbi:MAG: hypothetical protein ACJA1L_001591 [Paracoccaceae bacterium]
MPGDVNEGANPSVFANAYTNVIPFPTTTMRYVPDARTDSLATLGNNAGTLTTIGKIAVDGKPIDFSASGGMDILSMAEGDNRAFAILSTPGRRRALCAEPVPQRRHRVRRCDLPARL